MLPSLEAVQQFKLLTDAYAAEYGRMEGVLSVVLRSGGNQFHGSVFEFLRNDAMDARGFFDRQTPSLKRNQFGALLGGAIRQDSTFFLVSYEGVRDRQRQTRLFRVPRLDERLGQFAAPLRDPVTRRPFADNRIPAERIDPVAQALLAYVPEPNRAGAFNFDAAENLSADTDVLTLKLDHRLSAKDSLSARARYLNFDAAVEKEFTVGEGRSLQFRVEFFNALNRANFGQPATAVDQPTAGVISSAAPGR